jgi:DNA-binding CsgD family transcriptional regulator
MLERNLEGYEFLSLKERQVLKLMLEEKSVEEIADAMKLTTSSIYKMKKTISKKLKSELGL